jgi:cell division protein ZapA
MIEKSPKTEINQPLSGAGTLKKNASTANVAAFERPVSDTPLSRLFEVEIAGVPLRLKSAHDAKTVNELVALVDRKVKEALPLTKTGSIQNASILASLHLAEEYLTFKRKAKAELERLEAKTLKVISELESSRITGLQSKDDRAKGFSNESSAEFMTDAASVNPKDCQRQISKASLRSDGSDIDGNSQIDDFENESHGKSGPALET